MDRPIDDMLRSAAAAARIRFTMPGHKGKQAALNADVDFLDITELPGADNLYTPEGAILRSQTAYARSIGAKNVFFLVNGSSCGVETSILSALRPGDRIITTRDLHVSAVSAFILAGVDPVFIKRNKKAPAGGPLPHIVTPEEAEHTITMNPDAKAVFLTYPDFYGLCPDLDTIAAMAHEAGMLLICDAAHAAAFDYSQMLPASPAQCSADLWTVSLHKTLPAMNQCAALCLGSRCKLSPGLVQSRLNWMQTTSPSYILLSSCEYATSLMIERGPMLLARTVERVQETAARIGKLGGYTVLTRDVPYQTGAYDRDILRMVIDVSDRGLTGLGASRELLRRGIAVEGADLSNIVLICTVADSAEDYDALVHALADIKGGIYNIEQPVTNADVRSLITNEFAMPIRDAVYAPRKTVPVAECEDRVSAVCAGLYPPGVPILLPGQKIEGRTIRTLERLRRSGYGTFGFTDVIEVVDSES